MRVTLARILFILLTVVSFVGAGLALSSGLSILPAIGILVAGLVIAALVALLITPSK